MITYPVNVANTRWSVVRTSDSAILKHNIKWPRKDGGQVVGLTDGLDFLLEVRGTKPAYDLITEHLSLDTGVVDLAANTHTHEWIIAPLPQPEIDANTELEQAKGFYSDLKNHVGTQGERLNRTETVLAYLLKRLFDAS